MKKKILCTAIALAAILTSAGCGNSASDMFGGMPSTTAAGTKADESPSYFEGEGAYAETAPAAYDESYDAADYVLDGSFAASERESGLSGATNGDQLRAGLLTGGEWRDNSNFVFWKKLFEQREDWMDAIDKWKVTTLDRVFVRVKDNSGKPACGMRVKLAEDNTIIWQTVTDSRGEAFMFAGIDPTAANSYKPDKIIAEAPDGRAVTANVPDGAIGSDSAVEITVPDSSPIRSSLDLMLVVDTTGSMSDELTYLQTELESVIDRISDSTNADIHLSVNFYRDDGDDYVVRDFGFTKNISIALDHLSDQRARGGGDYPEAVMDALGNGLYKHEWRDDSEKIMLLVLDAPPHHEDGVTYLKQHISKAADMGVRIIPVASSGVDTDTEFLCRVMAMATGGTYTFLTDDSGIGESHLAPTIGDYKVEKLNDMLVRIINDYFSQEPRTYASSGQSRTKYEDGRRYPASYRISDKYYDEEGMYTTGVIRNEQELAEFIDLYGFSPLSYDVDFTSTAVAYKTELLTSGSITVDDSKGVYCTIEDGKPEFHYELVIPEIGTTDIKSVIFTAEIPSPALMVADE